MTRKEMRNNKNKKLAIKLVYIFATLFMVFGNVIATVPQLIQAVTVTNTITVDKTTVTSGDEVVATIGGARKPSSVNEVTVKIGDGLTFDENQSVLNGLSHTNYSLSADGKTLTFIPTRVYPYSWTNFTTAVSPWPAKLYFKSTNDGTTAKTADLSVHSQPIGSITSSVATTDTATVTINPKATSSTSSSGATSSSTPTSGSSSGTTTTGTNPYTTQTYGGGMTGIKADGSAWSNGDKGVTATLTVGSDLTSGQKIALSFPQGNLKLNSTSNYDVTSANGMTILTYKGATAGTLKLNFDVIGAVQGGVLITASRVQDSSYTSVKNGGAASNGYVTLTAPKVGEGGAYTFDPNSYTYNVVSAIPDDDYDGNNDGKPDPYPLTGMPLVAASKTDNTNTKWFSPAFAYDAVNGGQTAAVVGNTYSAAVNPTTNSGAYQLNKAGSNFQGLRSQTNIASGNASLMTGTSLPFEQDQDYTLSTLTPNTGKSVGFPRMDNSLLRGMYYLPDGIPDIHIDGQGNLSLTNIGQADGRAKKGQWSVKGTTGVQAKAFKIKRVQVVDADTGEYLSGVTVNFDGMHATTTKNTGNSTSNDNISGEIVPTYPDDTPQSGFYWAAGPDGDGTLPFKGLKLPASLEGQYIMPTGDFQLALSDQDNLSIVNNALGDSVQIKDVPYQDTLTKNNGKAYTEQTVVFKLKKRSSMPQQTVNTMQIKKVAKDNASTTLSGAKFYVEEINNSTDPVKAQQTGPTGTDGLVSTPISTTSGTPTRTFLVTETQAPNGYRKDLNTYYAKWVLGKGFTAVGLDEDPTAKQEGVASVDTDGNLVFADEKAEQATNSGYQIQYVNAAGQGINGVALPAIPNNFDITDYDSGESYSGLGNLVLNPSSDPKDFMTAATVNVVTGLMNNDSSMAVSTQTSGNSGSTPGIGIVQSMWSQNALPIATQDSDLFADINNAVKNGTILKHTNLNYSIQNPKMQGRAVSDTSGVANGGADAHDYYTPAQWMNIYNKDTGTTKLIGGGFNDGAANKFQANTSSTSGTTMQVILEKIKHVQIKDSTGKALSGFTALFKSSKGQYMVTNSDGELVPSNASGTPSTGLFGYPAGTMTLQSLKDSSGNTYDMTGITGGDISLNAATDKLSLTNAVTGKVELSQDAQTIVYTLPQTFVKMHVAGAASTSDVQANGLANVDFTVTNTKDSSETYTVTSDANGDIALPLTDSTKTQGTYSVTETGKAASGYSALKQPLYFSWTKASGITSVSQDANASATTQNASLANGGVAVIKAGGVLNIGLPQRISLQRTAMFDPSKSVADSANGTFTVTEDGKSASPVATFADNGDNSYNYAVLNNTADPDTVRTFSVKESSTSVPSPYVANNNTYWFTWSGAKGVISVGNTKAEAQAGTTKTTSDQSASVQAYRYSTDKPESSAYRLGLDQGYTIKTIANQPNGTTRNVKNASISLNGSTKGTTDDSGTQTYTGQEIKTLANASGTATKGDSVNLTLAVEGTTASDSGSTMPYNNVAAHQVTFTYGSGFSNANDQATAYTEDGVITGHKQDSSVPSGQIDVAMHRSLIRAQKLTVNSDNSAIEGATYTVTVTDAKGNTTEKNLPTDATGTTYLPDPDQFFNKQVVVPGQKLNVTIQDNSTLDNYQKDPAPLALTYDSQNGYQATSTQALPTGKAITEYLSNAPQPSQSSSSVGLSQWHNTDGQDVTTQEVDSFFAQGNGAGTQVIFSLKDNSSVAFNDAPGEGQNLNFGHVTLGYSSQSVAALPDQTGTNLSGKIPTTLASGNVVGVGVTQKGVIKGGWSVSLKAGNFTPAGVVSAGMSISYEGGRFSGSPTDFSNGDTMGAVFASIANSPTGDPRTIQLGSDQSVTMMSADGTGANANYFAFWDPSSIKLNIPSNVLADTTKDYAASMTWELNADTDYTN